MPPGLILPEGLAKPERLLPFFAGECGGFGEQGALQYSLIFPNPIWASLKYKVLAMSRLVLWLRAR